MTRTPRPGDTDVVLFVRSLGTRIAGGTRAVLARANLYAGLGYRTSLVVTGLLEDDGAWVRAQGLLHPDVRVLVLWRDGPDDVDRARARDTEPIEVPRIAAGPGVKRRRRTVEDGIQVRTLVDGTLRTIELLDPATEEARQLVVLREDGTRESIWSFAHGSPIAVDHLVPNGGRRREFVVDGRAVWLEAEVAGHVGAGDARLRLRDEPVGDYAGAIAHWLDARFASAERLVVFADGENVWQRALRLMRHPRLGGVSVLHNSHLSAPYDASAPTQAAWKGFFSDTTNVDVMVCLTERQRTDLLARYPGLPLRVLRHAAPRPKVRGVRRDPDSVVFIGRLAPQKQLDHLLHAFVLVHERVPSAHLDVYGTGRDEASLKELAAELGLEPGVDVRFHGGTAQALHAFAGSRVAAMSSLHEGLPLTLTEAMSVGTPFVAYDCNYGPAEVIRDGENGFLVPRDDVQALADRLVQVLEDDRLARRLSRGARRVTSSFSPRRYRDAWRDLLDDVARRESSRSHTVARS
ncbi:glycosyltransferase [Promicromonospora iranensis]|uniref:Poly(Glycerol-phosphate) alpha-glucosyltransferase n=1 Tax=Promicromonospora iranensis TaxID=1105144 RepID=A0ABU2CL23_9MICO|nr:glycosyltransferase [Promicromonospora iranensis]MDR7382035.1 poly(glycerol-phosphate) alpha-glucosyltransferase [Promicromonospora iranensis]